MDFEKLYDIVPKDPIQWDIEDVGQWLKFIGLYQYYEMFKSATIDGACLHNITDEDLQTDLGIQAKIIRKKLMNWLTIGIQQYSKFLKEHKVLDRQQKQDFDIQQKLQIQQQQQQLLNNENCLQSKKSSELLQNFENNSEQTNVFKQSNQNIEIDEMTTFQQQQKQLLHNNENNISYAQKQQLNIKTHNPQQKQQKISNSNISSQQQYLNDNQVLNENYDFSNFPQKQIQHLEEKDLYMASQKQSNYCDNYENINNQQQQKYFENNENINSVVSQNNNGISQQSKLPAYLDQVQGNYYSGIDNYDGGKMIPEQEEEALLNQKNQEIQQQYQQQQYQQLNQLQDQNQNNMQIDYSCDVKENNNLQQNQQNQQQQQQEIIEDPDIKYEKKLIIQPSDGPQANFYCIDSKGGKIGRHSSNQILILEESISRYHAEIVFQNNEFGLKDIGSTTGTFIKIKEQIALQEGMVIEMGSNQFQIQQLLHPTQQNMEARLKMTIIEGTNQGAQYDLKFDSQQTRQNVGRKSNNELDFPDDHHLSNQHSRFYYVNNQFVLEDMSSTNGSWIRISQEGQQSDFNLLQNGTIFKIGTTSTYICKTEKEEIKESKIENLCVICCESDKDALYLPCKHNTACIKCSKNLKECPICRIKIEDYIKIYKA